MQYSIDSRIFARYPGFIRAVIIAENMDNTASPAELEAELAACEQEIRNNTDENFKELPQLAAWAQVFRDMGLNPNRYPPSVTNLIKRVRGGKDLPFVNPLVAAFNCISMRYLCPCGGDDLDFVQGDLSLTIAGGDESYVPLGQPDVREQPPAGEIIFMDTAAKEVFCRGWCWKNGDKSKLAPATRWAAINIDILPPLTKKDAEDIASDLAGMLQRYTGAATAIHYLSKEMPEFSIPA